jgi:hypothetical protein
MIPTVTAPPMTSLEIKVEFHGAPTGPLYWEVQAMIPTVTAPLMTSLEI